MCPGTICKAEADTSAVVVALSDGGAASLYSQADVRYWPARFGRRKRDVWDPRGYFGTHGKGTPVVQDQREESIDPRCGLGARSAFPVVIAEIGCRPCLCARYGHEHHPLGRAAGPRRIL